MSLQLISMPANFDGNLNDYFSYQGGDYAAKLSKSMVARGGKKVSKVLPRFQDFFFFTLIPLKCTVFLNLNIEFFKW